MIRIYNRICLVVVLVLSYEYLVLNRIIKLPGLFRQLKKHIPAFSNLEISPEPGRVISYWLGWVGFAFMVAMLLYTIRKRFQVFHKLGRLATWLDFHIFCGIIGPILIIFHCNFKVGGLVAISFWSMIISATSGIVGRYFYFQILQTRGQLKDQVRFFDEGFSKLHVALGVQASAIESLKRKAIATACGVNATAGKEIGFLYILINSFIGDIALHLRPTVLLPGMHKSMQSKFHQYGRLHRKIYFLDTYKRFMGYWHAFHLPFAIFMYIVAVIHIITALLFKVHA